MGSQEVLMALYQLIRTKSKATSACSSTFIVARLRAFPGPKLRAFIARYLQVNNCHCSRCHRSGGGRQEMYGWKADKDLYDERQINQALHIHHIDQGGWVQFVYLRPTVNGNA